MVCSVILVVIRVRASSGDLFFKASCSVRGEAGKWKLAAVCPATKKSIDDLIIGLVVRYEARGTRCVEHEMAPNCVAAGRVVVIWQMMLENKQCKDGCRSSQKSFSKASNGKATNTKGQQRGSTIQPRAVQHDFCLVQRVSKVGGGKVMLGVKRWSSSDVKTSGSAHRVGLCVMGVQKS